MASTPRSRGKGNAAPRSPQGPRSRRAATEPVEGPAARNLALSAFRLGLLGHTAPGIWIDLFREMPELEWGTGEGILLAIRQLEEALLALAQDGHINSFGDLRRMLQRLTNDWGPVVQEIARTHVSDRAPDFSGLPAPRDEDLADLPLLAGQAVVAGSPYRPWANLGAAIGAYQVALRRHDGRGELPDFGAVIAAARQVAAGDALRGTDELHRLVQLASTGRTQRPRPLLARALGMKTDRGPVLDEGLVVNSLIQKLEERIQSDLQSRLPARASSTPSTRALQVPMVVRPENRTRPLGVAEAARLMGYKGKKKAQVKRLRALMDAGLMQYERLNRQTFIFNIRQFPGRFHDQLRPCR